MKRRSFLASLPMAAAAAMAESKGIAAPLTADEDSTAAQLPKLKFRANGSFKILAIADTHYYPRPDIYGMALTEFLIDMENPDLVIVNGDCITGHPCKTPGDVKLAIGHVAKVMEDKKVPWAITFGNHDRENEKVNQVTGEGQIAMYESYPHNLNAGWARGLSGVGNKNLPVWSADGTKPLFNVWLFDSGNGNAPPRGFCVEADQVAWYRNASVALEKQYGAKIPGLAFVHIPLQEFRDMLHSRKLIGSRKEPECPQEINGGLFQAIVERGDVKGVFCGHDHDNDYLGKYHGIYLGYIGIAGYYAYPHVAPTDPVNAYCRGGRVFQLSAADPANFRTWLRYRNGASNWELLSEDYLVDHLDEPEPPKYWAP